MMKGKMLVAGVATLSIVALLGCQQQPAAQTTQNTAPQPETKTSTATLQINPATQQQSSEASLEIKPASTQQ